MVAKQWADAGNLTDDRKCPVPSFDYYFPSPLRSMIIIIITTTMLSLSFLLSFLSSSLLFLSGWELISPRELIGMNACALKGGEFITPSFITFKGNTVSFRTVNFDNDELLLLFSLFFLGNFSAENGRSWFFSIIGKRKLLSMIPFLRGCNLLTSQLQIDYDVGFKNR